MVSATRGSNPNPKSNSSKNVYHIGGIQVEFPYQPYGSQFAFMSRVISTLDRAHRDGHCHALLESPTGTGKSLSLLCSALAWQQSYKTKNQYANLSHSKPAPEAITDPLAYGGGFVPETQPSSILPSGNPETVQSGANKNQKKKMMPTIYYASRTHSQISQVIREYRKTAYRVPMAVLASRKHYCTNPYIRGKENMDEECKLLLKNQDVGCSEFKNAHKVKGHPSLQKGGCHEVHDIEDLVKVGQIVRGCSYYAARSMADDAHLVFCPYSYVINPVIRRAMDVDIKEAIVILDEAHNIEDIARDAGSVDVEEDVLLKLQTELEQLSSVDASIYQPLCEMTQELISWIERRKNTLEKREFQHYFSCWTGDKALRELQEATISQQCFPVLLECATKAIKVATDAESDVPHLSGMSVITLEGLFSSLTYFFSRNGSHILDYQLALHRYLKKDAKNALGSWTHSLSLWCLNPAVVFRDIAELSLSIILTSGTLSPINSFSSELGVQFGTCLEAPHVIDVESQVWAAVISTGPGNYPLNASYKTADAYAFQDALGKSLEEICKIIPGGSLVFFPSYKLMEKLCARWHKTGQWSRLNLRKSLFVEPRGGSQEEFEPVLKGYYDSISGRKKPVTWRKKRTKKTDLAVTESQENSEKGAESLENTKKEGAVFLAVCRGKVSEGIDFADDNARVVIVVGIPFPNINDAQVAVKKRYNDTYKSSKNILSGNEWYCHQAFRALNQAAGRCIRHRFDYGAIILLDERYQEERNRAYISKWLRKSIRQYDNFEMSLQGLQSFFRDVKDRVGNMIIDSQNCNISENNVPLKNESWKNQKLNESDHSVPRECVGKPIVDLQNCQIVGGNIPSTNPSKGFAKQKSQKLNKFDHSGQNKLFLREYDGTIHQFRSRGNVSVQGAVQVHEEVRSSKESIEPECRFQKDSRCCEPLSMTLSNEDPDVSIVKETYGINVCSSTTSPHSFSKDENCSPTLIWASAESPSQSLIHPESFKQSGKALSEVESSMVVTPEKDVTGNTYNLMPETESSLNLSANSHAQKRRSSGPPIIDLEEENFNAKAPCYMSFCRKIEFGLESNYPERKSKKSDVPRMLVVNNNVASCPVMGKKLRISCSLCRSPLGLPENHLYVNCLLTMSSKAHLVSLLKEEPGATKLPTSVSVLITDTSSVDQRLCRRNVDSAAGQSIWCEQDGCVFNNICCPFCSRPNHLLGVQIMATDSSNVQLLNKILFYFDRLEIRNEAVEDKDSKHKESLTVNATAVDKTTLLTSFENFSYSPKQQDCGGWRATRSKLRLPRRGVHITEEE